MSSRRLAFIRERRDLLARASLAAVQVAAIAWFSPGPGLPLDDAWIHQVVARTFAETGTLGYAPGQHGAAATSYLWAALLAVDFKLGLLEPSRWALALNGLAALASGQLLYAIVRRARAEGVAPATWDRTAFAATLLASISPNVLWFTCSGMEAMPFVALSLAAIWAATSVGAGDAGDARPRSRRAIVAGVAAGALALLRPEAAPLGGLLAAHALLRKRRRDLVAIAGPWIACVAVYVGSNVVKTGHAAPSTLAGRRWLWFEMSSGLSRSDRALDYLDAWGTRLGSYTFDTSLGVVWVLIALAAYGALRLAHGSGEKLVESPASEDAPKLLFAWALFHSAFYALLLPTPGHGGRYQPLTPLLFALCVPLGVAFVLRELARIAGLAERARFGWLAAIAIAPWIALAAPIAGSLRHANALAVAHIQATELGAGGFVDKLPEGEIASFDIGGIGYASRRRIVDLGGLSDPKTAALLESGRIATWLEEKNVRWLVLPQSYEPTLPTFEDYRTRLHLADNAQLELEPVRVLETPFARWEPAIRATWNAAPKQVVYEVRYTKRPGPRDVAMIAPGALRAIADPTRQVRTRDRVVAEHMLATLAAWKVPVDVRLSPAPPESFTPTPLATEAPLAPDAPRTTGDAGAKDAQRTATDAHASPNDVQRIATDAHANTNATPGTANDAHANANATPGTANANDGAKLPEGPCAIQLGWWGIAIEGCASVGDPRVLRAAAYEHAGRYLDVGDLGGALRAIPHVIAATRRRVDPGFHPPLAPLMQPIPGGVFLSPLRAGGYGLALFAAVLVAALAIETAARRDLRLARLVTAVRARAAGASLLAIGLACGCGARGDAVARAIPDGRGAVEIALADGAREGDAALLDAAAAGDAEIVSLLLARGAKLDARAPDGASALHLAARRGHHAAVTVLSTAMRSGDVDATAGPRLRTALHDAVLSGSVDAVSAVLRAGADVNKADAFGQTALHLLATKDPHTSAALLAVLMWSSADPSRADARGFTALHAAAATDHVPLVRALVLRTPLVAAKTPGGETALDVALRYARDRGAEVLWKTGATPTREGAWPPLHEAARTDALERAAGLLASGADTQRRANGRTALEIAQEHGSARVEALLRDRAR